MNDVLVATDISRKVKEQSILSDISFSVKQGEIIGLIGPNGAGKTSLMRIIVGLTKKYEGNIEMNGITNIGCMIETPNFYPYLTAIENLKYFAALNGVSKAKIPVILDLLGLTNTASKKVKHFSLGMRQRLGIAQALLTDPELLILDEPTNGLDPEGMHEIREYIKTVVEKKNITVIISSHLLGEIEKICSRALIIKAGVLIKDIILNSKNSNTLKKMVVETPNTSCVAEILKRHNMRIISQNEDALVAYVPENYKAKIADILFKERILVTGLYEEDENLESTFLDLLDLYD